jgi:hypothetical protein
LPLATNILFFLSLSIMHGRPEEKAARAEGRTLQNADGLITG